MPIVPSDVCSTCALDKKPNIPIDVININTTTAIDRYALMNLGATFQFWYSHEAVTSFPTSNTDPITIIGMAAPAKMAANPNME